VSAIRRLRETGRPLVLTEFGKAAAILVQPDVLDDLAEERELIGKVLLGLQDIEAGALVEDAQVWQEVDEILSAAEQAGAHPME
jgi:hypothetical protein